MWNLVRDLENEHEFREDGIHYCYLELLSHPLPEVDTQFVSITTADHDYPTKLHVSRLDDLKFQILYMPNGESNISTCCDDVLILKTQTIFKWLQKQGGI